jgi:hypothetical protein
MKEVSKKAKLLAARCHEAGAQTERVEKDDSSH